MNNGLCLDINKRPSKKGIKFFLKSDLSCFDPSPHFCHNFRTDWAMELRLILIWSFFVMVMAVTSYLWNCAFADKDINTCSKMPSSYIINLISNSAIVLMHLCIVYWDFASNQDQNQLCSSKRLEMTTEKGLEVKVNP